MKNEVLQFPPINKFTSRKEWESFCYVLLMRSEKILKTLLTAHERHQLVMRAVVLERLKKGERVADIKRELWVSRQTISTMRKTIDKDCYYSYRERGKTERKKKNYHDETLSRKKIPDGRRVRTKYGTIHVSY